MPPTSPAASMATLDPITVTPDTMAATALDLMERNGKRTISVLPVVDPADPGRGSAPSSGVTQEVL